VSASIDFVLLDITDVVQESCQHRADQSPNIRNQGGSTSFIKRVVLVLLSISRCLRSERQAPHSNKTQEYIYQPRLL
jgi:hypothetical protein